MHQAREGQLWGIVLAAGDGTRVRDFLARLCGGRGIKQFCAVIGRRSMLEHTLARVEWLIPRERILVVVSSDHREEAARQLADWSADNVIFQPANCDTAPGILLPLAYVSQRDPLATVAIFPSDHFILREGLFMAQVRRAVEEIRRFPWKLILLGMRPDRAEEGYGWIEPAAEEHGHTTLRVARFWEKPSPAQARELQRDGALWNTFVCVARAATVWAMTRQAAPDLCSAFTAIRWVLKSAHASRTIERVYETLRPVNFSSGVCQPLPSWLRVLRVPEVGWSDWGSEERICASLQRIGKLEQVLARLPYRQSDTALPRRTERPVLSLRLSLLPLPVRRRRGNHTLMRKEGSAKR
jgi:mannose-1-phosphate guanylyltransferase